MGSAFRFDVLAQDAEQAELHYALDSAPTGMSIDAATGRVSWTPVGTQVETPAGDGTVIGHNVPSDTVVVKLSYFPPGATFALEDEVFRFFRAVSAWQP